MKKISLYLMAALYVAAGFNHFRDPGFYLRMMPPWIPAHGLMIQLSGVAEILGGIGLIPRHTRRWAAWGLIALLIAVFPANIYMYQNRETLFADFSPAALLARLPIQLLLIGWAYLYTRRERA